MPQMRRSWAQRAEVNCDPRSVVMAAGTPKDETQPCEKASRTDSVEISFIGIAVGHRVILSTIVSKYGKPFEVGTIVISAWI